MLVTPDTGACLLLDTMLAGVTAYCHLYAVDLWPDRSTYLAELVEPDWSGYVPLKVDPWSPSLIVDGVAQATADPVEWVRGATGDPVQIYGYYITDGPTGPLLWAERMCGRESIPMEADGDVCVVWPLITDTYRIHERCIQAGGLLVGGDIV